MLLWSSQWKIVNNISLSVKKKKITYAKISQVSLERDRIFLDPNKFSSYLESDFKFLVLWTCMKYTGTRIDILKKLQSYTQEDRKYINTQKSKIIYYQVSLDADKKVINPYVKTPSIIMKLFNTNQISIIGAWWHFKDFAPSTRIQTEFQEKLNFFMDNFTVIKENLQTKKENNEYK